MPSLYVYIIICFKMHCQQRMTHDHRKKDGGRKFEAKENQGVDMIGKMGKGKNRGA